MKGPVPRCRDRPSQFSLGHPPTWGVAKLSFRDIMGYCMVYFIIYTIVVSTAFLLLPAFFAIS
jgi:hypothetical protein